MVLNFKRSEMQQVADRWSDCLGASTMILMKMRLLVGDAVLYRDDDDDDDEVAVDADDDRRIER